MRWLKFNAVGSLGLFVQLGSLGFFVHILGLHYLLATALAVEAAVLHNFFWHKRWTWSDRRGSGSLAFGPMLLRFNLTTGLVSIAGNLLLMRILTGAAGLEPVVANLLSIAICSLANFLVSDRFVFVAPRLPRPNLLECSEGFLWKARRSQLRGLDVIRLWISRICLRDGKCSK